MNLLRDYGDVLKETSSDIKQRPKKALAYAWGNASMKASLLCFIQCDDMYVYILQVFGRGTTA